MIFHLINLSISSLNEKYNCMHLLIDNEVLCILNGFAMRKRSFVTLRHSKVKNLRFVQCNLANLQLCYSIHMYMCTFAR